MSKKTRTVGNTALSASEVHKPTKETSPSELELSITDDSESPSDAIEAPETTPETSAKPPTKAHVKRLRTHKWLLLTALAVVVPLLAVVSWAIYGISTQGSLASYSTGGVTISKNSDRKQLSTQLSDKTINYSFDVKSPGSKPISFSPKMAGITVDTKKTIDTVLKAQQADSVLSKLSFWKTYTYPLELSVEEIKFRDFTNQQLIKPTVEPKNAVLSTETGEVVVTPEVPGKGLTVKDPRTTLLGAISKLKPNYTISLTEQSVPAVVTTKDIQPLVDEIMAVSTTPVSITVGSQVYTANKADIISWVDPVDPGAVTARFEINSGKVLGWIKEQASHAVTRTQNEVRMKKADGSMVVLTAGRAGVEVAGLETTAKQITDSLTKKTAVEKSLSVITKPFKYVDVNTYNKWLLADLSNHMLYAYEKDQLIKSFPMSAGAPETPTVVGEFAIYSKVRVQTMRGPNTDGTSYNVPNVEWVSYFTGSYAIHGNYWRPLSVFGNTNTSHGCIGMVNANSQWVYEWAPIGTPVITYK